MGAKKIENQFEMHCFSISCTKTATVGAKGVVRFVNENKIECPVCKSILVKKYIGIKRNRKPLGREGISYGLKKIRKEYF